MVKKIICFALVIIFCLGILVSIFGFLFDPSTPFDETVQLLLILLGVMLMLIGFSLGLYFYNDIKEEKRKVWKAKKDKLSVMRFVNAYEKSTITAAWTFSDTNLSAKQDSRSGQYTPAGMKELSASQDLMMVKW